MQTNGGLIQFPDSSASNSGDLAFTGTVTITAAVQPSGANHRLIYQIQGKLVNYFIWISFSSPGTTVTNLVLSNITQLPDPLAITGWSNALSQNYRSLSEVSVAQSGAQTATTHGWRRNAGNTAWEISPAVVFTAGSYAYSKIRGQYISV